MEGIPFYVLKKGNADSGAILIKVSISNEKAMLYHSVMDQSGFSRWDILTQGDPISIEKNLEKQICFDQDLWVVEVEEKSGRCLLENDYLRRG